MSEFTYEQWKAGESCCAECRTGGGRRCAASGCLFHDHFEDWMAEMRANAAAAGAAAARRIDQEAMEILRRRSAP